MKASEIIDCTCTVVSICSISRFACANVWSVRVVTSSIDVTFVGVCFAFVNICQKKRKKEKRMKNGIWFLFKSHTCTCLWKKWKTRLQFFGFMRFSRWTCKSNRYFSNFHTLVQQRLFKAYATNCSCFPTGAQNTLYVQKEKEWNEKLIIHDRISLQFWIHLCNFVHFQYILADNRIHVIHWCWCSLRSHDKSGFLYTRQRLWNHRWKKWDIKIMQKLPSISHYRV